MTSFTHEFKLFPSTSTLFFCSCTIRNQTIFYCVNPANMVCRIATRPQGSPLPPWAEHLVPRAPPLGGALSPQGSPPPGGCKKRALTTGLACKNNQQHRQRSQLQVPVKDGGSFNILLFMKAFYRGISCRSRNSVNL